MYNYIISFFRKKQSSQFSNEFKTAYKNGWINKIKDYTP